MILPEAASTPLGAPHFPRHFSRHRQKMPSTSWQTASPHGSQRIGYIKNPRKTQENPIEQIWRFHPKMHCKTICVNGFQAESHGLVEIGCPTWHGRCPSSSRPMQVDHKRGFWPPRRGASFSGCDWVKSWWCLVFWFVIQPAKRPHATRWTRPRRTTVAVVGHTRVNLTPLQMA